MPHKTKYVLLNKKRICIDENIVCLIKKLWKLKINTTDSCQSQCSFNCNHKYKEKNGVLEVIRTKNCYNNIWISFLRTSDFEKFYNIIIDTNDKIMFDLICCNKILDRHPNYSTNNWAARFVISNKNVIDKSKFELKPSITFPKKHLQYVESKLDLEINK